MSFSLNFQKVRDAYRGHFTFSRNFSMDLKYHDDAFSLDFQKGRNAF